jgi:hypothetical protein
MIPNEHASERMILRLDDDALSGPLPELGLGCPELLGITTGYEGCVLPLLALFLFLLFGQFIHPSVLSVWIGLIDFHYHSFRTFSGRPVSALASDLKGGCFITLQAWAVLNERSLRDTTVFNLKHNWYGLHAWIRSRLPFGSV